MCRINLSVWSFLEETASKTNFIKKDLVSFWYFRTLVSDEAMQWMTGKPEDKILSIMGKKTVWHYLQKRLLCGSSPRRAAAIRQWWCHFQSDSPDNHEAFSKQTDNILYDTDRALVIVITICCCGQQQPVSVAIWPAISASAFNSFFLKSYQFWSFIDRSFTRL